MIVVVVKVAAFAVVVVVAVVVVEFVSDVDTATFNVSSTQEEEREVKYVVQHSSIVYQLLGRNLRLSNFDKVLIATM